MQHIAETKHFLFLKGIQQPQQFLHLYHIFHQCTLIRNVDMEVSSKVSTLMQEWLRGGTDCGTGKRKKAKSFM